jgi:hypothetical protein
MVPVCVRQCGRTADQTLCLEIKSRDYPPSAIDGVSGPG